MIVGKEEGTRRLCWSSTPYMVQNDIETNEFVIWKSVFHTLGTQMALCWEDKRGMPAMMLLEAQSQALAATRYGRENWLIAPRPGMFILNGRFPHILSNFSPLSFAFLLKMTPDQLCRVLRTEYGVPEYDSNRYEFGLHPEWGVYGAKHNPFPKWTGQFVPQPPAIPPTHASPKNAASVH